VEDKRFESRSDLIFIIQNYLDAGNLERLFEEASDIVDSGDYNYEAGSVKRDLGNSPSRFDTDFIMGIHHAVCVN
jgi:hypothetical protein